MDKPKSPLFVVKECVRSDEDNPIYDLLMVEPHPGPERLPPGDTYMILFDGITKGQAEHFLERANQALDHWLKENGYKDA